ncbi:hypothetical protein Ahu01nite_082260 [Winogradskya humida]|uniref:Uncharacterized protein n=1 Tax=Winogradskya humida TaxID=113566 RepID=A0ABQ4A2P0_9ACTN|nr:hypothetical protein Ahu01nite_082260 [Actinoplanes humidus]
MVRIVGGAGICAVLALLSYGAVPSHAAALVAVREQCSTLPGDAFRDCITPVVDGLVSWVARVMIVGVAMVVGVAALHPWWMLRGSDQVPEGLGAELAGLAGLAGPGREPAWVLAPYAYTSEGRAFGLPWRPCVRLDVGLVILFRTDRARFRAVITRELDRLRDRAVGAWCLAAGSLLVLAAAIPAAGWPGPRTVTAIDACLVGFWAEVPHLQPALLRDATVAWVERRGAIWSFTGDGAATLYLGSETVSAVAHSGAQTIGTVAYSGAGTIRWRLDARHGRMELAEPAVTATLSEPGGASLVPEAGDFALPDSYSCRGNTTTTPTELTTITLRRIGP